MRAIAFQRVVSMRFSFLKAIFDGGKVIGTRSVTELNAVSTRAAAAVAPYARAERPLPRPSTHAAHADSTADPKIAAIPPRPLIRNSASTAPSAAPTRSAKYTPPIPRPAVDRIAPIATPAKKYGAAIPSSTNARL
jgi:hypothetical protein